MGELELGRGLKDVARITYIIWDAGGTLFDTYPSVVEAAHEALRSLGQHPPPDAELLALFRQTTARALRTLAQTYAVPEDELETRFSRAYDAIDPAHQPPFPGVVEICRHMVAVGGQNFVVTHRGWASLRALLAAHDMRAYFTACITKEDPYPRKPDPTALLALLACYDLDPVAGLAIGDRALDIQAGQRAGLHTCFFGKPHTTAADVEIEDFRELMTYLDSEEKI